MQFIGASNPRNTSLHMSQCTPTDIVLTDMDDNYRRSLAIAAANEKLLQVNSQDVSKHSISLKSISRKEKKKKVLFNTVEVRKYRMTLGDHPGVSGGPPVTIAWKPFSQQFFTVENHIRMTPLPRRKPDQMAMPVFYRELVLKEAGFSRSELLEATRQANIVKNQRTTTVRKLQMAQMEELGENMKRKMKKIFFGKKKTESEYRLKTYRLDDIPRINLVSTTKLVAQGV